MSEWGQEQQQGLADAAGAYSNGPRHAGLGFQAVEDSRAGPESYSGGGGGGGGGDGMMRQPRPSYEDRITVEGIENGPGFSVVGKIVGRGGGYLRHISELAHCKVFLKGRGFNFQEDQESPLHLHVMCRSAEDMDKARELCNSLLDTVRKQYEDWKEDRNMGFRSGAPGGGAAPQQQQQPPQQQGYPGAYPQQPYYPPQQQQYQQYQQQPPLQQYHHQQQQQQQPEGEGQPPSQSQGEGATSADGYDWAAYYAYYGPQGAPGAGAGGGAPGEQQQQQTEWTPEQIQAYWAQYGVQQQGDQSGEPEQKRHHAGQ